MRLQTVTTEGTSLKCIPPSPVDQVIGSEANYLESDPTSGRRRWLWTSTMNSPCLERPEITRGDVVFYLAWDQSVRKGRSFSIQIQKRTPFGHNKCFSNTMKTSRLWREMRPWELLTATLLPSNPRPNPAYPAVSVTQRVWVFSLPHFATSFATTEFENNLNVLRNLRNHISLPPPPCGLGMYNPACHSSMEVPSVGRFPLYIHTVLGNIDGNQIHINNAINTKM